MPPHVSVIVAARNAERVIPSLLAALNAQTLPRERFEVVIVDDASRDQTTHEVAQHNGDARLIALPETHGAYAARNRALREATGDVIAITDADCLPAPDWLERLLAALEHHDGVGGRIRTRLPEDPPLPALVDAARRLDQQLFLDEGFVAFANFACHRRLIDEVGPFNEQLRSNGDREWCLRAVARGATFGYAQDAIVDHPPRTTAREVVACFWRRGVGRGRTALVGTGPAVARRRNWSTRSEYLPAALDPANHPAARRLREAGFEGGTKEHAKIDAATYLLAGAPLLAGYVTGTVGARLRAPFAAPGH